MEDGEGASARAYALLRSLDPFDSSRRELLASGTSAGHALALYPEDFDLIAEGLIEHLRATMRLLPADTRAAARGHSQAIMSAVEALPPELVAGYRNHWRSQVGRPNNASHRLAVEIIRHLPGDIADSVGRELADNLWIVWYCMARYESYPLEAKVSLQQVLRWYGEHMLASSC